MIASLQVGRDRQSGLHLSDTTISFHHCEIGLDRENLFYFVTDHGSSNGTFVECKKQRKRMTPKEAYRVSSGERISFVYPTEEAFVGLTKNEVLSTFSKKASVDRSRFSCSRKYFEVIFYGLHDRINRSICTKLNNELDQKYYVFDVIGTGTYATVRRAVSIKTKQEVAIKIIDRLKAGSTNLTKSWKEQLNEATLLEKLDHPCIIKLLETVVTPEKLYIVMELAKGGELFDRLLLGAYPESSAKELVRNIVHGIHYLHGKGIIHRDLKPENILLISASSEVDIKLADFGVAKEESGGRKTFCGSLAYIAPEVLQRKHTVHGTGKYGKSADMWSLGIVTYIILTGRPPFHESSDLSTAQQLDRLLKFTQKTVSGLSMKAKHFLKSLLVIDPSLRMTSAEALEHPWFDGLSEVERVSISKHNTPVPEESKPNIASSLNSHKRKEVGDNSNEQLTSSSSQQLLSATKKLKV